MANPIPQILGVPGVSLTNREMPIFNAMVEDEDARALRADIAPGLSATFGIIRIDNRQNSVKAYLKFWDEGQPVVGTTPPAMILRCNPGRITEYYVNAPIDTFTYQALTEPGKGGTDIPDKAVPVTFGLNLS